MPSLVIAALIFGAVWVTSASAQSLEVVSFETKRIEETVQSLINDRRYVEAISYLHREIETRPAGSQRVPLLLLLVDCQLDIADLDGARATLAEAEGLAASSGVTKAIADRRRRFNELQKLMPPLSGSEGGRVSGEAPTDTAEEEKGSTALVTNYFFENDLRQVLTDLSQETGVPILWDATVEGLVTYEAEDKPLDDVLKAILLPAGYTFSFQDGAYYVGSPSPDDPAFVLLSRTEVMTLSNIEAKEAISLLSDYFKPFVKASNQTNVVCITAPPAIVQRIHEDLEALDQPAAQILIEVVATEIATDALRKMGLDWWVSRATEKASWHIESDHTDIANAALLADYVELGVDIGQHTVDLAASLEALVESGDAQIRANPRIATLNGRTAEIGLTRDQYFIIATSVSEYYQYNTLQSVSSGIKLEITPYASEGGMITVYVKPEVGDVIGEGREGLPEINRRTASTAVRVKDGETFTIGGLNITEEKTRRKKIPLLGEIPILGYLFRYDEREVRDTEIIIFITPHIL